MAFNTNEENVASGFRDKGVPADKAALMAKEFTRRLDSQGGSVPNNVLEGTFDEIFNNRNLGTKNFSRPMEAVNQSPVLSAADAAGMNAQSAIELMLKFGPELSQLQFDTRKNILPQELALQQEFQPQFQELSQRLLSASRTGDIGDVESLIPALKRIQENQLSPAEQELKSILSGQITSDLRRGESLSPEVARQVEQAARTAEVSRGISGGRGSANREAVRKALEGRKLKQERQGAAGSFLAQSAAERIDPILAVTGRPSTSLTSAQNATAPGSTPNPIAPATQAIGIGNQFAQQDVAQQAQNLQVQLAQSLQNRYGF